MRIAAAGALAQVGLSSKVALPALRQALKDKDKFVRCQSLEAIGKLGADSAEAVPDILECLKNEKVADARVAAIKALGELGPVAKDAVGLLSDAAKSTQPGVSEAATEALRKIQ